VRAAGQVSGRTYLYVRTRVQDMSNDVCAARMHVCMYVHTYIHTARCTACHSLSWIVKERIETCRVQWRAVGLSHGQDILHLRAQESSARLFPCRVFSATCSGGCPWWPRCRHPWPTTFRRLLECLSPAAMRNNGTLHRVRAPGHKSSCMELR
jgi:hypothetical protein